MEPGETMASKKMIFLHIINKLENLGNTNSNQDFSNKILSSMCSEQ